MPADLQNSLRTHHNYKSDYWRRLGLTTKRQFHSSVDVMVMGSDEVFNCLQSIVDVYYIRKIKQGCHNKRKLMLFKTGIGRSKDRKIVEHNNVVIGADSIIIKDIPDGVVSTGAPCRPVGLLNSLLQNEK